METVDLKESKVLEDFLDLLAREDPEAVGTLDPRVHKVLKGLKEIRDLQGLVLVDLLDPWEAKVRRALLGSLDPKEMLEHQDHRASQESQVHKETVANPVRWVARVFEDHKEMWESKVSKVTKVPSGQEASAEELVIVVQMVLKDQLETRANKAPQDLQVMLDQMAVVVTLAKMALKGPVVPLAERVRVEIAASLVRPVLWVRMETLGTEERTVTKVLLESQVLQASGAVVGSKVWMARLATPANLELVEAKEWEVNVELWVTKA